MNKNNAKALSTLRQKIRKYNRDYESEIAAYKEVISGSFLRFKAFLSVFLLLPIVVSSLLFFYLLIRNVRW